MDARKTPGAGFFRPVLQEIHSDSPGPLSIEQVYRDYAPQVYRTARRMVNSDFDAEDITQEVLLQVVRKLDEFRGDSAFATWLHRVTVNAALAHRRRLAVREEHGLRKTVDVYGEDEPATSSHGQLVTPDNQMLNSEARQLIDDAIEALPPAYRSVFVLSDVEEVPNADIADRLGMTLPAVKSRLHRARAMLREALAPHFDEVVV